MSDPLQILLLSDGKPGHENQSYGLTEALKRIIAVKVTTLPVEKKHLLSNLLPSGHLEEGIPKPDLIIGAGHTVHGRMLALSKKNQAPCVVMMKPSLPIGLFSLCLIPYHDLHGKDPSPNMIATRGALNRVTHQTGQTRQGGLIMIGGPSSSYGWESESITKAITTSVNRSENHPWQITDSRRTPDGELENLAKACPSLLPHPHTTTAHDWLPERLAEVAEVWVSEDSVSMIYEALSSGARVGLLPAPRLKPGGRIAKGIDELISEGYLTPFSKWDPSSPLSLPPNVLQEAKRCADEVVRRFFPERLPTS